VVRSTESWCGWETSEPLSGLNIELRRVEGTADSPLLPKVFPSGEFSLGAIVAPNSPTREIVLLRHNRQ
jgi:hypothetical protein